MSNVQCHRCGTTFPHQTRDEIACPYCGTRYRRTYLVHDPLPEVREPTDIPRHDATVFADPEE